MRFVSRLSLWSAAFAVLVAFAAPAQAKLEICNKTPAPFTVAIAFETDADVVSQGWWTVDPDKCTTVVDGDLSRQYYYHYIRSRALNVEWAGTFNFCTTEDPQFRISGAGGCEERNFHITGFRQIDVGSNKDFSLDITMGPAPAAAAVQPPAAAPATTTPQVAAPAATTAPVTPDTSSVSLPVATQAPAAP